MAYKKIIILPLLLIFLSACATVQDFPMDSPEDRVASSLIILGNPPGTFPVSNNDIPELLQYANDENPTVRHMAVYQLQQLDDHSFFGQILHLLNDEDKSVARNTEEIILQDPEAASPVLRSALDSENESMILKSLDLLVRIGDRESLPDIVELFNDSRKVIVDAAVKAASKLAEVTDRILFDTLLRSESSLRIGVIRTFAAMGDPSVLGTLLPYFYDEDLKVRNAVKFAFVDFGEKSLPYLINVLKNPVPETQLAVLGLMEALQIPEAIPEIIIFFDDENERVRTGAAYTVSTFHESAIPYLGEALLVDNPRVIRTSVELLGKTGSPEALNLMIPLLNHRDLNIRTSVFNSIMQFGDLAGDRLLRILDDRYSDFYEQAVKGLVLLRDVRLVDDSSVSLSDINNRNIQLITRTDSSDFSSYLLQLNLSGLQERDFSLIKEIYLSAKQMSVNEIEIRESGSVYISYYISRNEFRKKAEEALKRSFAYMHSYMENKDPKDLERARDEQDESERYRNSAAELESLLKSYDFMTEAERELILAFEKSKESVLRMYNNVSLKRKNLADLILAELNLSFQEISESSL